MRSSFQLVATGFLRELGKPCRGELKDVDQERYRRHEKRQRQSLHFDSPFLQPSDSLSYLDFKIWVKDCCGMGLSLEGKKWKLKSTNGDRIRCYQVDNILPNSAPLASGCCVVCVTVPFFLYMTLFKCCSSFTLAGISLMSTAMKSSENNNSGDCSLSHSATFPKVQHIWGLLIYLHYFHTLLRDVQLELC